MRPCFGVRFLTQISCQLGVSGVLKPRFAGLENSIDTIEQASESRVQLCYLREEAMRRLTATFVILAYLGVLNFGVISHALKLETGANPAMYYVVWDMFCGWSGYETRVHLVAEGASGSHYQLNPAPWGDFQPYGSASRIDYDSNLNHSIRVAQNVLNRTTHEPIRNIYVVEENWSKRYNRPEYVWNREFEEPREPHSYHYIRAIYNADGTLQQKGYAWTTAVSERELASDPRMAKILRQGKSFFVPNAAVANSHLRQNAGLPTPAADFSTTPASVIQPASYSQQSP